MNKNQFGIVFVLKIKSEYTITLNFYHSTPIILSRDSKNKLLSVYHYFFLTFRFKLFNLHAYNYQVINENLH